MGDLSCFGPSLGFGTLFVLFRTDPVAGIAPAMADMVDELLATVRELRAYERRLQVLRSRRIDTSEMETALEMRCLEAEGRLEWLRKQREQAAEP